MLNNTSGMPYFPPIGFPISSQMFLLLFALLLLEFLCSDCILNAVREVLQNSGM